MPEPVGNPTTESEIAFWSRQLSEHALFFALGLVNPMLKARATALHAAWERARPHMTIATAVNMAGELRSYKTLLLERLNRGEWLGWIFPLFVDHTRRELDYFVARVTTGVAPQVGAAAWLRFMAEHAAFAAHLMDPTESARIREAVQFVGTFEELGKACDHGVSQQLFALSTVAGTDLDRFVATQVAHAKSIIHPVLAAHVLREGRRFLAVVQQLQGPR